MTDRDDDDLDPGPIPDPDAEPTPAEKARARAFSELVDKVVAGRAPAAMSPEDRALVETATMIRAVKITGSPDGSRTGNLELPAARAKAIVDQALFRAIDGPPAAASASAADAPIPIDRAKRSRANVVIAVATVIAAVAAVVTLLIGPPRTNTAPAPTTIVIEQPRVPETWTSRPADRLVGVIPQERAGAAAARIDAIFADRLDGYRERTLARGGRSP
jgi:hypothetical protein